MIGMSDSLVQLQKQVKVMRHKIEGIEKKLGHQSIVPIIVERVDESELTPKERKHLREARADIKSGRMNKFITLEKAEKKFKNRSN